MTTRGCYNRRSKQEIYELCLNYERLSRTSKITLKDFCMSNSIPFSTFQGHWKRFRTHPTTTRTSTDQVESQNGYYKYPVCKHKLHRDLWQELNDPEKNAFLCPTCNVTRFNTEEEQQANESLLQTLRSINYSYRYEWPDINLSFASVDIMPSHIIANNHLRRDSNWKMFLSLTITCRLLQVRSIQHDPILEQKVKGAYYPSPHQFQFNHDQLLSNPRDGSIGIVTWTTYKGTTDYAILDTIAIPNESIVALSKEETSSITKLQTASRFGAAGGYVKPSTNTLYDEKSCSAATQQHRYFERAVKGNSTYVKIRYKNPATQRIQEYGSVYKDIYMTRSSKRSKRLLLYNDFHARLKTLLEMQSRLKALLVIQKLQLNHNIPIWTTFHNAIQQTQHKLKTKLCSWRMIDPALSFFQIVLLEWAATTGDMQNHRALAAHTDGNKSHFLESMTVFGRVPGNAQGTTTTIANTMTPGQLLFPFQAFGLIVRPGKDALHLQCKNTMHVPDTSRNELNWSWVHGP